MKWKTKYKEANAFRSELLDSVNKLTDKYNKIQIALNENLYPLKKDSYHFVTRMVKTDYRNRTEHAFLSTLYRDIYRTEILSASAGQFAFVFALNFAKNLLTSDICINNESDLYKQWDKVLEKIKKQIEENTEFPSDDDLEELVSKICLDKELSAATWEALKLSGLEGKIFVENGRQDSYVVELKEGYSFNLSPYKFFLENGKWESKECKALVVDGFIESVSEIDGILNDAYKLKQPMALISQGFSEEVVSTLFVNYQKKNINVIPLRLMPDINNLNVINDIGVVCGMQPISSLKGELLTFVKWENLPTIPKILVTEAKTTIENPKTRANVSSQIQGLIEKREENHLVEDIQNIIDKRMKSLVSNAVYLHLPDMSSIKNDTYRVRLDNCLRQCKTLLNYGHVNSEKIFNAIQKQEPADEFEKLVFGTLKQCIEKGTEAPSFTGAHHPSLSLYTAVMLAGKTILMLLSAAGHVELDIA